MRSTPDRISRVRVALCRAMQIYVSYCYELEAEGGPQAPVWRREGLFGEAALKRINERLKMMVISELGGDVPELNGVAGAPTAMIVPKLYARLQAALLAAFDEAGLKQLARLELDVDLDTVAGGADLEERVFSLIAWATRTNRIADLVAGAQNQNPNNPALKGLVTP